MKQTALASLDSYKLSHMDQFAPGTTKVYSNFTPRSMHHFNQNAQASENKIVWFGLQVFLIELNQIWKETFFDRDIEEVIAETSELYAPFCGPNGFDFDRFRELHALGYLPLEIKALPEGSRVNIGVPVLTITNTVDCAYWLPNFLETWMSAELWKSSTSATTAYEYRKILDYYYSLTGASNDLKVFAAHDFSVRGMSGIADSAKSGAGHLLCSCGTDNIPAVELVNDYYFGKETFVAGSVPASEHSVMSSSILIEAEKIEKEYPNLSREEVMTKAEFNVFKRLITEVYPSGIVSLVSDTFDFWSVLTKIAPALKNEIMTRKPDNLGLAKLVFRPDSGDPVDIICGVDSSIVKVDESNIKDFLSDAEDGMLFNYNGLYYETTNIEYFKENYSRDSWMQLPCTIESFLEQSLVMTVDITRRYSEAELKGAVECLWDTFGGTETEKGYRTLDSHVGLIYGDSITLSRAREILDRLAKKGFAADNIVFGVGSYTYNYVTRDTLGFALKCTYVEVNGKGYTVYKEPKTDSGTKKSARGLLRVRKEGDNFVLDNDVTPEQEKEGELRTVFINGVITRYEKFADIRTRLNAI